MPLLIQSITQFWTQNPALLYGIAFLLGCSTQIFGWIPCIFPACTLWLPLVFALQQKSWHLCTRLGLALFVAACGFFYPLATTQQIALPREGIYGSATLEIHESVYKKTAIGPRWFVKGKLIEFTTPQGQKYTALPVSMMFAGKEEAFVPTLSEIWKINGTLKNGHLMGQYLFKGDKKSSWIPLKTTWKGLFAEKRQTLKNSLKNYILTHMQTRAGPFLSGMVTGDFDDIALKHQFGKFGLQHILTISGFHFSLLALVLGIVFKAFFPYRIVNFILILCLTLYFLLLGTTPSILRAWCTIVLALAAHSLHRRTSALNLLGLSLILVLLVDPLYISNIGFQFSFGITAGILFFCQPFESALQSFSPQRPLTFVSQWVPLEQHCYILSSGLKTIFALSAAVNIAALPLILFHFQALPLFSLIYNLFFPFLISISLWLLLLGMFSHLFFGTAGTILHWVNDNFTHTVIGMAMDVPASMNIQWHSPEISSPLVCALMTCIFAWGCYLKMRKQQAYNTLETVF